MARLAQTRALGDNQKLIMRFDKHALQLWRLSY